MVGATVGGHHGYAMLWICNRLHDYEGPAVVAAQAWVGLPAQESELECMYLRGIFPVAAMKAPVPAPGRVRLLLA